MDRPLKYQGLSQYVTSSGYLHLALTCLIIELPCAALSRNMQPEKRDDGEEAQAFLNDTSDGVSQKPTEDGNPKRGVIRCARLAIEIAMAVIIIYLVAAKPYCGTVTIRRTPVPKCEKCFLSVTEEWHILTSSVIVPRKIYTFKDHPEYVNGDMWFDESKTLKTLHNWIPLSSSKPIMSYVKL